MPSYPVLMVPVDPSDYIRPSQFDTEAGGGHQNLGPFSCGSRRFVPLMDRSTGAIGMYRSEDEGVTWEEVDATNHPVCFFSGWDDDLGIPMTAGPSRTGYSPCMDPVDQNLVHIAYIREDFTLSIKTFDMAANSGLGAWDADRPGGPSFDPGSDYRDNANNAPVYLQMSVSGTTKNGFYATFVRFQNVAGLGFTGCCFVAGCTMAGAWGIEYQISVNGFGVLEGGGTAMGTKLSGLALGTSGRVHAFYISNLLDYTGVIGHFARTIRPPDGGSVIDSPFLGDYYNFTKEEPDDGFAQSALPLGVDSSSDIVHFVYRCAGSEVFYRAYATSADNPTWARQTMFTGIVGGFAGEGFSTILSSYMGLTKADCTDLTLIYVDGNAGNTAIWTIYDRRLSTSWGAATAIYALGQPHDGSTANADTGCISASGLTSGFSMVIPLGYAPDFYDNALTYPGLDPAPPPSTFTSTYRPNYFQVGNGTGCGECGGVPMFPELIGP